MEIKCNLCYDRGIILKNGNAVPCSCWQQRVIEKNFKESLLPEQMYNHTFENFNFKYYAKDCLDPAKKISYYESTRLAYQAAKNFINEFLKDPHVDGLLFTGQVGSGKTFLACCIANAILKKGKMVLFLVVPDFLDKIRATYDYYRTTGELSEQEVMGAAREVPLLILDDLGIHNYTEWARNKLYSIVNYRLNHRLPIIVTTNINLEDMSEFLGERTTSRLVQMCRSYRLMVDLDIRIIQRQERGRTRRDEGTVPFSSRARITPEKE